MRSRRTTRLWILVAGLLAFACLGAAGAETAPLAEHTIPTLVPARLPRLPAQGLVVEEQHDVLLETMAGVPIGRLAGFSVYAPGNLNNARFARTVGMEALAGADPALTIVYDQAGDGFILDVPGRKLEKIGPIETQLAGGAKLEVVVRQDRTGGVQTRTVVKQNGKTLLSGLDVEALGSRYVTTDDAVGKFNELIDLVTGHRTTLGARCETAGIVGARVIAGCAPASFRKPAHLYSFASDGSKKTLTTFLPGLVPASASVSPDAKWVLVNLAPGCGPGWAAVAPTAGGVARYVAGGGTVARRAKQPAPAFSYALGWTGASKIVATIAGKKPSSCDHETSSGTFLIDPASLARTRSTPVFAASLWGSNA